MDYPNLDIKSVVRLQFVHPDLCAVVKRASDSLGPGAFIITEGDRTLERQKQLKTAGASQTLKSRHLRTTNGYCHAVDLAALVGGDVRWDWPLYDRLAKTMKEAAFAINVPLEWGGDWRTLKDGPHFQLPWGEYP